MLQRLKVAFYRRYYRFSARRAWGREAAADDTGALELATAAGPIAAHLYSGDPQRCAQSPLIVYFHGGGWVIGDLLTHHAYCKQLSAASGCTVIAIDYRLAPEHRFPAAQRDCLAAAEAVVERAGDFGAHNGRVVLAGDSAGGHLSFTTALSAQEPLREHLAGLISTYPVVDHYSQPYASYRERATGQKLTASLMRWFWDTYLGDTSPEDAAREGAFPIRDKRLAILPPVLLCTAGRDPLRDEGIAMVGELQSAGVPVEYEHYANSEHGFACSMGASEDCSAWLERCAQWIARLGEGAATAQQ